MIIANGFFLSLDQFLKYLALSGAVKTLGGLAEFRLFLNKGVAFGIPLPNAFTIFLTIPMLALIGYLAVKEKKGVLRFSWSLIFFGALSNFADRILRGNVVDYLRIFISTINIADAMIILGLGMYLINLKFKNQNAK